MKTKTADFKKSLGRVRRVAENGEVDRALAALEKMLNTWPDQPLLLLEKARLIQLSERGSLAEAKRALKRATELGRFSADTWIELGFFLHCIDDRAGDAEGKFDKAIGLALRNLTEALAGKIDTVIEQATGLFPPARQAEMENVYRLAKFVLESHGPSDSWAIQELREILPDLQKKLRCGPRSGRNGK